VPPSRAQSSAFSSMLAWCRLAEVGVCQFASLTLLKNVNEQRTRTQDRRPPIGPTDNQQGTAKAGIAFSQ